MTDGEKRRRLTAEDWATAALTAIGENGLAGVAVEPIAARLGATKGSFYWHFANRDALVVAALELWEQEHTEAIIASLHETLDPVARLRSLLASTTSAAPERARVEVNLLAAAEHPLVAPAVRRVTDRRVGYLRAQFAALGFAPAEAKRRALLAYTTYVGHLQLAVRTPGVVPQGRAGRLAYLDTVTAVMLSRT